MVSAPASALSYDSYIQQQPQQQQPSMSHMTWVPPAFTSEPKYENIWPEQRPQQLHLLRAQPLMSPLEDMQQQHLSQQQHGLGVDYQLFSPLKFLNTIDVDRVDREDLGHQQQLHLHHHQQQQQQVHLSQQHHMQRNHHMVRASFPLLRL
jgi:hypothetical protein